PAHLAQLEVAPVVDRVHPLQRLLERMPQKRWRRIPAVDRTDQRVAQRRLVLLDVECNLLIRGPAQQWPDQPVPCAGEDSPPAEHAKGDDGCEPQAAPAHDPGEHQEERECGRARICKAAEDQLCTPAVADGADQVEQPRIASLHGVPPLRNAREGRVASTDSMVSSTIAAASTYHHSACLRSRSSMVSTAASRTAVFPADAGAAAAASAAGCIVVRSDSVRSRFAATVRTTPLPSGSRSS